MKITTIGSGSTGNCYLIEDGSTCLLLDAGISFKKMQKSVGFKTRNIQAVLITHDHGDHAAYVKQYIDNGLDVYMTEENRKALNLENHYRIKIFSIMKPFKIANSNVLAIEAIHDAIEPCNFIIATDSFKLLYATDTKYVKYDIDNLTHIMIEGNYVHDILMSRVEKGLLNSKLAKRITDNHMSIETTVKYLKKINKDKLKEVTLIHLSKDNSNEDYFKEKLKGITGCKVKIAKGI